MGNARSPVDLRFTRIPIPAFMFASPPRHMPPRVLCLHSCPCVRTYERSWFVRTAQYSGTSVQTPQPFITPQCMPASANVCAGVHVMREVGNSGEWQCTEVRMMHGGGGRGCKAGSGLYCCGQQCSYQQWVVVVSGNVWSRGCLALVLRSSPRVIAHQAHL